MPDQRQYPGTCSYTSTPDYYKVLQVDPMADVEVIDAAYRRLARKYHPDVYKGADAEERMRSLNVAHAVLCNPAQRYSYDETRKIEEARKTPIPTPFVQPEPPNIRPPTVSQQPFWQPTTVSPPSFQQPIRSAAPRAS